MSVEESTRYTAGIVASVAFLPPLTSIASTIALQWGHPAVSGEEVRQRIRSTDVTEVRKEEGGRGKKKD